MEIRTFSPVSRPAPTAPIAPGTAAPDTSSTVGLANTPTFRRSDPSRQTRALPDANSVQGMLSHIAARPAQLRRVLNSLGGGSAQETGSLPGEAAEHVKNGGSLSGFAEKRGLDAASLQLIGTRAALDREASDPGLAQTIRHELERLQDHFGTAIGAALNTAAAIHSLDRPQSDRAWLRTIYLSVVTASAPVLDAYESLLQRFGPAHFERGALAMMRALSDDMNAPRASVSPDKLQILLLSSMVTIRHLIALIHTCRAFLRQPPIGRETGAVVQPRPPSRSGAGGDDPAKDGADDDAELATVRMIKLLLQLTTSSNAVKLVPAFLEEDVVSRVHAERAARARNEFIDVIRALPPTLWKDPKLKDQLIELLRRQAILETSAGEGASPC